MAGDSGKRREFRDKKRRLTARRILLKRTQYTVWPKARTYRRRRPVVSLSAPGPRCLSRGHLLREPLTNRRSHRRTTHSSLISRNHFFLLHSTLGGVVVVNFQKHIKFDQKNETDQEKAAGRNLWSMWWSQRCIEVQVMRGSGLARRPLGSLECSGHGSARYGTAAPLPAPHLSLTWASVSPPPLHRKHRTTATNNPPPVGVVVECAV